MQQSLTEHVQRQLSGCHKVQRWVVALSGGLDSMVLLELMSRSVAPDSLLVIHVNHQLQAEADQWQRFCQQQAEQRGLAFIARSVVLQKQSSIEAAARDARYQVFGDILQAGDCLLLGHHGDDQAETVLYRLLRGAGVRGLSGIPASRGLAAGHLLRPLLQVARNELEDWARQEQLNWVEDPSNAAPEYDRNFLRQEIFPLLKQRWPGLVSRWSQSSGYLREADLLLSEVAEEDFAGVSDQAHMIDLSLALGFSAARLNNLLRYWCQRLTQKPLSESQLKSLRQLISAADDRQPELLLHGYEVRRYRQKLFVMLPENKYHWQGGLLSFLASAERLENMTGQLSLIVSESSQARVTGMLEQVRVRNRQEGDRCQPAGRFGKTLKQLFQEAGVPPWQRDSWPVCVLNDEIVAVPGICLCEPLVDAEQGADFWLDWQPSTLFAQGDSGIL